MMVHRAAIRQGLTAKVDSILEVMLPAAIGATDTDLHGSTTTYNQVRHL